MSELRCGIHALSIAIRHAEVNELMAFLAFATTYRATIT
jgi:hypothetical protein